MYRTLFSAHENFLNLSAKSGSGATRRKEEINVREIRTTGLSIMCLKDSPTEFEFRISGSAAIKIVFAGVGNPIKESVCLVSILNFANRIAEKIVTKKPTLQPIVFSLFHKGTS